MLTENVQWFNVHKNLLKLYIEKRPPDGIQRKNIEIKYGNIWFKMVKHNKISQFSKTTI